MVKDGMDNLLIENGSWGPAFDGTNRAFGHVVDNAQLIKPFSFADNSVRDFYETGNTFTNTINISGGGENATASLTYTNLNHDGVVPTSADSYEKNSIGLSGMVKGGKLTATGTLNYINTGGRDVPSGQGNTVQNNIVQIPNDFYIPMMKDYNSPFWNIDNYYTPYSVTNPYYTLNEAGVKSDKNRVYGSVDLTYELTNWLRMKYRVGIDFSSQEVRSWSPIIDATPDSYNDGTGIEDNGEYELLQYFDKQINHDFIVNSNLDLIADVLSVDGSVGFNYNERQNDSRRETATSLVLPGYYHISNTSDPVEVAQQDLTRRIYGLFGTATFNYKDQLYVTGNIRNDWTSTLSVGNNSYLYGGINASWIATETFPNLKGQVIDYLKFRGGYGVTGNDTDPFSINDRYVLASIDQPFRDYNFPVNGEIAYASSVRKPNPDLKPETKKEWEIGADLRFFNGRFNVSGTYYDAKVEDQISRLFLPSTSGYSYQIANIGTIRNKGIELLVQLGLIRGRDFSWDMSVNYTKNEGKLQDLVSDLDEISLGGLSTISLIAQNNQPIALIEGPGVLRDPDGNIVVDANGIPKQSVDNEVYGDTQYDYTAGIINEFSYKNFDLSFSLDIRQGGVMYSRTADITRFTGNSVTTMYNNREPFIVPGSVQEVLDGDGNVTGYVENTTAVSRSQMDNYYNATALSGENVIDRSYVKLRDVTLGYSFPSEWLERTPLRTLKFSVIGKNLALWTPSNNQFIDPEISTFGTDLEGQFGEFSANPRTRSIAFSIRASF